jgi:hypothetical protein
MVIIFSYKSNRLVQIRKTSIKYQLSSPLLFSVILSFPVILNEVKNPLRVMSGNGCFTSLRSA